MEVVAQSTNPECLLLLLPWSKLSQYTCINRGEGSPRQARSTEGGTVQNCFSYKCLGGELEGGLGVLSRLHVADALRHGDVVRVRRVGRSARVAIRSGCREYLRSNMAMVA